MSNTHVYIEIESIKEKKTVRSLSSSTTTHMSNVMQYHKMTYDQITMLFTFCHKKSSCKCSEQILRSDS